VTPWLSSRVRTCPTARSWSTGSWSLHTYTPYRVLGSTSLLCLGVALFLLARGRVGAPLALVVAVSVLWLPMMGLTPFMANYRVSLLCGVVCAAAMPSTDRRSDVVVGTALAVGLASSGVGTALAVGLASSGVGMALAAACAVHAVVFRPRASRWTAVAVPSLLWVLWWRTLGNETRSVQSLTILSALDDVADGVFSSFGALTRGWWVGGAVLLTGWGACSSTG
jgi:hypothetical protein